MKQFIGIIILLLLVFLIFNNVKEGFDVNDNKLIVIIPVRDREVQLKEYLNHMIPIFKDQNIDYKIYIVEQSAKKDFNKAKINNVGFLESIKDGNNVERYLFNDVDNYPIDKNTIQYKTNLNEIHHFFGNEKWLGGFYTISKTIFKKINGYSNDYWGWGGEDDDILNRTKIYNIKINRNNFTTRRDNNFIINDPREKRINKNINKNFKELIKKKKNSYLINKNNVYNDGLTTCKYSILKKEKNNDNKIIRLLVDV